MSSSAASLVRQKYRSLGRLVNRLPEGSTSSLDSEESWNQLRVAFREPLGNDESVDDRIKKADDKLAFLRMITPKAVSDGNSGRWIYKNGKRVEGSGQVRDKNGRVISNWDGKNLDPDSVKQHNYQLKRMGFRNNDHAKGIF
mmetsp:Transcript_29484/g.63213  ORF Transcript_29484/g.63213 Transcript_29484/m.63213 type:complete len:142 (-) Transcript_29484:1532-1957(-)